MYSGLERFLLAAVKGLMCGQGTPPSNTSPSPNKPPLFEANVYLPLHFLLSLFQPLFHRRKNRLCNHANLGRRPKFTNSISEHGKMVLKFQRIDEDTPLIEVLYNVPLYLLFPSPLKIIKRKDIFCHKRDTRSRSSDTLHGPKTWTAVDIKSQPSVRQFSFRELRISRNKFTSNAPALKT